MRLASRLALAAVALSGLLAGCATTVEMGPGYYHYDTGVARPSAPAVVYQEPAVVYREPAVVYREPTVVYRDPAVVYFQPAVVYRPTRDAFLYKDHGQ